MKKLLLISLLLTSIYHSYGQAGAKWATGGNSSSTGDFIGTTNNFPLIFKTNNTQKMVLSTTGVLQLNNLAGTGNRLLQTDASGNIIPFTMGTSSQVLYGNGLWGSLPAAPSVFWNSSGSNIYFNTGKVGIGTSTPLYPLDVIGDVRISNNLYVGGGIIITDKVNAATEVVTSSIKTDSIATDSTMGFYGTTKFNGDVKLQNKLAVNGDALINGKTTVNGDFKTLGSLTFAGSKKISYTPPVGGGPGVFDFGGPGPIIPDPCYYVIPGTTVNQFTGLLQSYQSNAAGTGVLSMGFDTENGIIDLAGVGTSGTTSLLINYICGKDVSMCTGTNGGFVATGNNFEVGLPNRSEDITVNVKSIAPVGLYLTSIHSGDYFYNTKLEVNRDKTKALAVYNSTTSSENFVVYGNGAVGIGTNLVSNPNNYMLAVNGLIGAKELKIEITSSTWPDFVFDKNYKMISIKDLEAYLNKNKHLPNIPSSSDVEKNGGVSIGEMQTKLLQKIEELSLYIIEQNKRIEILENVTLKK